MGARRGRARFATHSGVEPFGRCLRQWNSSTSRKWNLTPLPPIGEDLSAAEPATHARRCAKLGSDSRVATRRTASTARRTGVRPQSRPSLPRSGAIRGGASRCRGCSRSPPSRRSSRRARSSRRRTRHRRCSTSPGSARRRPASRRRRGPGPTRGRSRSSSRRASTSSVLVLAGANGPHARVGPGRRRRHRPSRRTRQLGGHRASRHALPLPRGRRGRRPDRRRARRRRARAPTASSRRASPTPSSLGIPRDADVPTLTLVTCWPFDAINPGGPLRYVVVAEADGVPRVDSANVESDPVLATGCA